MNTDTAYSTGVKQDTEHAEDWKDQSVQMVTDSITGNYDVPYTDQTHETVQMAYDNNMLAKAIQELMQVMHQSGKLPVQRVSDQGIEIVFKSVYCPANTLVRVCATNYNRSRVILSGMAANVFLANDKNISVDAGGTLSGDAIAIGFLASTTPFLREVKTYRDLYVLALTSTVIGVQEEFMAA